MSHAATEPTSAIKQRKMAHAPISAPVYMPGRRDFFSYRDLGVINGSAGEMRAQVVIAKKGLPKDTGWHYHDCEHQFDYVLKGWVELQFEGGRTIKLVAGDSIYIPGGCPHNETVSSDDFEILEVTAPAEIGTIPCDPPEGW